MVNALALPHILEITFDALTAAVGIVVILLALRVAPTLTLFAHRRPTDLDRRCSPDRSRTNGGGVGGFLPIEPN
jgi:hypothetical protein